jgi:hypothetical protein
MFEKHRLFVLTLALALPGVVQAANSVVAGTFDGTEAKSAPLPGTCGGSDPLAYQVVDTLRVSVTGDYTVFDALWLDGIKNGGVDVSALIYTGVFDIDNPDLNLVTPDGIDYIGEVTLQAGVSYKLVVQQWCVNREGAWALTFTGPGEVDSSQAVTMPDLTEGRFAASDPVASTVCSDGEYHVSDPVQVPVTGSYFYIDVFYYAGLFDVCVLVYEGEFDPARPEANRVPGYDALYGLDYLDDVGMIQLESGKDYSFVVQSLSDAEVGDYFFMLAPPAPFRISKALAGAWYNPDTDGQGFFLDVYENQNFMFLSWFTYDLQRPVDGTAELGEPGHRWLTAQGPIDGATAVLDVNLSAGGVFDASEPSADEPAPVGSMTVEFTDCMSGSVEYTLTTPAVSGQIPITTIARLQDHVELCELMTKVPGVPGPF